LRCTIVFANRAGRIIPRIRAILLCLAIPGEPKGEIGGVHVDRARRVGDMRDLRIGRLVGCELAGGEEKAAGSSLTCLPAAAVLRMLCASVK